MRILWLLILLLLVGIAGAENEGAYILTYENIRTVEDTLYLDFIDSVSNAYVTFEAYGTNYIVLDNNGNNGWKEYMSIPVTRIPSASCVYKIVIENNIWRIYNATGDLEIEFDGTSNFWEYVKPDGSDIRVFNEFQQLYFWIEEFDYTNRKAVIWVLLSAGSRELNIAYGNPSASRSSYYSLDKVVALYEDFEDGVYSDNFDKYGSVSEKIEFIEDEDRIWLRLYPACTNSWIGILSKKELAAGEYVLHIYYNCVCGGSGETLNLHKYEENEFIVIQRGVYSSDASTGTYKVKKSIIFYLDVDQKVGIVVKRIGWDGDYRIDYIIIISEGDYANFGTGSIKQFAPFKPCLNINGNEVRHLAEVVAGNPVTLEIPSEYFVQGTNIIKIYSENYAPMKVTIKFNYAFGASVTMQDYYNYIRKSCSVKTSHVSKATFTVAFPLRTTEYKINVSVEPSATYYTQEKDGNILVSFNLEPSTNYQIDVAIGYLIANLTCKDELSASQLDFTVEFTNKSGIVKLQGKEIKIFGTHIKSDDKEVVIKYYAKNYVERKRIINTKELNQSIVLWLLPKSEASYVTFTVVSGISTVPDAKITVEKFIKDDYYIVAEALTDFAGSASIPLKPYDIYRITVSKQGYTPVKLEIEINRLSYTIQLGSGITPIGITEPIVAHCIFYPLVTTLAPGKVTITFKILPKFALSEVGLLIYINDQLINTTILYNVEKETRIETEVSVQPNDVIKAIGYYIYNGQRYQVEKTYVVPSAVGVWSALNLLNDQLQKTKSGSIIALLIAVFITLVVVCSLAYFTTLPAKGLGFVALTTFSLIAVPLNAIPVSTLVIVWMAAIALIILWR